MKTVEQLVCEKKFPNEPFDADNYYDWARENSNEAFDILSEVTRSFPDLLEALILAKEVIEKITYLELGVGNKPMYPKTLEVINNAINKATK